MICTRNPRLYTKISRNLMWLIKNKTNDELFLRPLQEPTVYRPYPRKLESLTICKCHYKGSIFWSVISRPWELVSLGFWSCDLSHSSPMLNQQSQPVCWVQTYQRGIRQARLKRHAKTLRGRRMQNMTCSQLSGFIVQFVEHCTGIANVMGLNPIKASWLFHVYVPRNCICMNQLNSVRNYRATDSWSTINH